MKFLCNAGPLGALPPDPQDLALFPRQNGSLWHSLGDRLSLSPAVPAAEPVARVASQHCPIPSGSGDPRMDHFNLAVQYSFSERRLPLNFVSHSRGSLQLFRPRQPVPSSQSVPPSPYTPQSASAFPF
jgi:hypothetical protein